MGDMDRVLGVANALSMTRFCPVLHHIRSFAMKDAALRSHKDRLLEPVAHHFLANVPPNQISFLALGAGLLAAPFIVQGHLGAALACWLLNRLLDGLDGVVARLHNKKSDLGGYLDLLLDFVVYLAVPIAFVVADPSMGNIWALIFLLSSYQVNTLSWTVLSALLEKRRAGDGRRLTSVEMPVGLIEGAETVAFYTLFFLLPGALTWLFSIMAILVFFTAAQRIWWARTILRD